MKTETKIMLVLVSIILIFLLIFFLYLAQNRNIRDLFLESEKEQKKIIIEKLLKLHDDSLLKTVNDYTCWDDMVVFTRTKSKKWGKENIHSVISSFNVNYCWTYDIDQKLFDFASAREKDEKAKALIPALCFKKLLKTRFISFYLRDQDGIICVSGSTIHPTSDLEKKTDPQGFFFIGKRWDKEFISELEKTTDSRITTVPFSASNRGEKTPLRTGGRTKISVSYILPDHEGKELVRLDFVSENRFLGRLEHLQQIYYYIYLFISLLIILLFFLSLQRWVYRPLKLVSDTLSSKDLTLLKGIKESRNEFGTISELIKDSFKQKEMLEKEIEKRNATEKALEANEEKYRVLFESESEALFLMLRENGNIVEVNQSASVIYGYTYEEFLLMKWPDLRADTASPQPGDKERNISSLLDYHRKKNGSKFPVEIITNPLVLQGRDLVLAVVHDISERKKLEDQLIQAEKLSAVGLLASGIAHEFNNILTIIKGNIELYMTGMVREAELKSSLNMIIDQSNKGKEIVSNLIYLTKPLASYQGVVNIDGIINDVLLTQRPLCELEHIEIRTQYAHHSKINVDPGQIQQVLLNLIINARQAITPKKKGCITISTRETNNKLEVRINDTGIGMDEKTQKQIFTPFFTTKGAYARDNLGIKGTGLGLAMSFTLLKNNQATISFESEKGTGTTFVLLFNIC
ncbi:MAG: ATP-binding protein [bacterium]|nr:ATP-binding protein [bacterium]